MAPRVCLPDEHGDEPARPALTLVPASFPVGEDEATGRRAPEYDANGHYCIGPKLAQAKWAREMASRRAPVQVESPSAARGRMEIARTRAAESVRNRPPAGFFACGHPSTGANVLPGARRVRCRECFNARRRDRAAAPTPILRAA